MDRWNRLHPTEIPRVPHIARLFEGEPGPIIASSDYMKAWPDQLSPWLGSRLHTLGTDGFGRSETRAGLREFFEVDYRYVIVATLSALARDGRIDASVAQQAIKAHGINPEKANPAIS